MRRLALPLLVLLLVVPLAAPAGAAQDAGAAQLEQHQSVLARLSNVGAVRDAKVVTQLTATGQGPVTVTSDDAPTSGLRNLDGFDRPTVVDGSLSWDLDLSGTQKRRTIADYDKDLPLAVSVGYELDGETVRASRLRGRSGLVTVTYSVANTTAAPVDVSFRDADGEPVSEAVDVVVPYVGTLKLTLPGQFRDIDAPGATVYGDGQGSTVVQWTMLLFEPLGQNSAEVSFTARMSRGSVPGATLEAIPVNSATFSSLASALDQYKDAERDTQDLRNGARDLDRGAIRLAAGAGRLLNGMMQLAEGSQDLRDGLAQARDGSDELAQGMTQASTGGSRLATGLMELRDGTFELNDGLGAARIGGSALAGGLSDARGGAVRILDGLNEVDGGLALLSHPTEGLPSAQAGIADLRDGIAEMREGLGDPDDPHPLTIIGGLDAINAGAQVLAGNVPAVSPGLPGAKQGVDSAIALLIAPELPPALQALVDDSLAISLEKLAAVLEYQAHGIDPTGAPDGYPVAPFLPSLEMLLLQFQAGGICALAPDACAALVGHQMFVDGVIDKLVDEDESLTAFAHALAGPAVLGQVSQGLSDAIDGVTLMADNLPTIVGGLRTISGGLTTGDLENPGIDEGLFLLDKGLDGALDGIGRLKGGSGQLVDGQGQLVGGLTQARDGAGDLASGLVQLDDGGDRLTAGARDAASGASDLSSGLLQLDDGANRLAGGLVDAADGSTALADGLQTASIGGRQVADGSATLQESGTAELLDAVAGGYGSRSELTARLEAVDARGVAEGLPYGAPEGATATAAYRFLIAGTSDTGGAGDAGRGLAGLGLLGGALVLGGVGRRRMLGV